MQKLSRREALDRALGRRLKQLRRRLQIDAQEAARRAGVSERSWRAWEAATVSMNTGSFLKIGYAFNCSFDWLAGANVPEVRS
jgi:transcriptional regulator with XRE-family HTH domain